MSTRANRTLQIENSSAIIDRYDGQAPEAPLGLTENAITVLETRYLKKSDDGTPVEKPRDMFMRVAKVVAGAEDLFGNSEQSNMVQALFYNMMASADFMPNSPTLMNAGRDLGQLSACFVLPIEDSMDSIFQSVKDAALIHKSGGGTGFSFSRLRPKNDIVRSTHGVSSGPVSFMSVYDSATETIKQGGTRRGANMGILRVDHPDIRDFITCKNDHSKFTNFNISVAVTDAFMSAVISGGEYDLVNPHTRSAVHRENAAEIFDLMVRNAHAGGDPGIVFIDRINQHNPLPHIGDIEATNPCGEQPLLPYESCNLGSVNLSNMVTTHEGQPVIDWKHLGETVRLGVRFLDNVIEVNKFPLEKIAEQSRKNRKIGLGVMGFADMLIRLGIPYDSDDAERIADQVMDFVNRESKEESRHLAELRGPFETFHGSIYDRAGDPALRNATTTTIAPTGTISIIASCSSGIEPIYSVAYTRHVLNGRNLIEFHPLFKDAAEDAGILNEHVMQAVAAAQSLESVEGVPDSFKQLYRTAHDVSIEWHIKIQAAFQRHTDNAVSKTINFKNAASVDDVKRSYLMAHEHGLKGITIYRDGSRTDQVLKVGKGEEKPSHHEGAVGPRPRPAVTRGATEKLQTGCGKLYVTVNQDDTGLCEVFCQMGRSGGCTSSQSEAISRLISLALRSGVELDEIVSQLKGIRCPSPIWNNGTMILSCADAIATALTRYLEPGEMDKHQQSLPVFNPDSDLLLKQAPVTAGKTIKGEMAGVCPDCGGVLEHTEGCLTCRGCGYSKCM